MARLIIAGGVQRQAGVLDRDHSRLFEQARVVALNTSDGSLETLLHYRDAPEACGQETSRVGHVFKGIAGRPDGWLLCTQRSVVWVDRCGEVERVWSSPMLNDVHHALEHDGALWVASTGLDAVLEVRGEHMDVHALADEVDRARDHRCVDRRPHAVHPNHLFVHNGALWVTCLHDRGARCVRTEVRRSLGGERVHDGVVHEGTAWFTSVDGHLLAIDEHGQVIRRIALPDEGSGDGPRGWCRGLAIDDGVAWVGFSRLRATPWRNHLAWVRGALRGWQVATRRPSHVVGVDLATGEQVASWPVEDSLHAIFGLECAEQQA